MKKKNLFSFFIYLSLLNLSLNPIYSFFWLALLLGIMTVSVVFSSYSVFLLPFYISPFMLIIKYQNPESLLILLLPELTLFIAIIFFLFNRKIYLYEKNLFYFLSLFSLLITFSGFLHILEIFLLPALIRQYVLPILFLIIFINASLKKNELPLEALKICIYSFSIVSIIALLNYFNFVEEIILNPILGFRYNLICSSDIVRISLCSETNSIPRLDLLISGSTGSASAIFIMLGIVCILLRDKANHLKYFSLPLFAASFFSSSVSILFPIIYLFLVILLGYKFFKIAIVFFVIFSFLLLTNLPIFGFDSGYIYFISTLGSQTSNLLANLKLSDIFFGYGPIIESSLFRTIVMGSLGDVGIFRIALENGFFLFIFFLLILFYILNKALWLTTNLSSNFNRSLLLMLITLSSLVHVIAIFTPPFSYLFIITVSGIIVQYKLAKMNLLN